MDDTPQTKEQLLEIAWSIFELSKYSDDFPIEDLLEGVERDLGKTIRYQVEHLLEVECNP